MADDSNHPARELLAGKALAERALAESGERARRLFWPGGLSARLFVLTGVFVAIAELLILAASLATFEERWLVDRVRSAEVATIAFEGAVDRALPPSLLSQLRERSGAMLIRRHENGVDYNYPLVTVLRTPYVVDLRGQNFAEWLTAPVRTLLSGKGENVRVIAHTASLNGANFIELVAPDAQLKSELVAYLMRLLWLTLIIAMGAGALVFVSLNLFLVKPMQRITRAMERFRADPDDPLSHIDPSGRRDEIGRAEVELNRMQADLRAALNSRARLATLGEAVAKINHDLRNMLTSAQIASERLALSGDPGVVQALPRLERALDRAARLTTEVLAYGKSQEPVPAPVPLMLKPAVAAAAEDAGMERSGVKFAANVRIGDRLIADPDHLHRILTNLLKNARQAVTTPEQKTPGQVRLEFKHEDGRSVLRVIDNGPGVPARALERLFTPFTGSGRPGGTGLGLAISRELAQAHGGDLVLKETGPQGSVFEVVFPGVLTAQVRRKTKV